MSTTEVSARTGQAPVSFRQPDRAAFGIWSGGHYLHFGTDVGEERLKGLVRQAYQSGVRTFLTADAYGEGRADSLLGEALAEVDRSSYCLVGMIGHDFYKGTRQAEKGFPRFTDPSLRPPDEYASYLRMAAEKSLERLRTDRFDLLMLHNPDLTGYTSEEVWEGMAALREAGLTAMLGIAPGPANGFSLDLIWALQRFGHMIDWAMLISNPFEPWPSRLVLPSAEAAGVKVIARVVDYGGIFLDAGLRPGVRLGRTDHRSFRPAGWVEAAHDKLQAIRPLAEQNGLSLLQLACEWTLSQPAVESVAPTLLQESAPDACPVEELVENLAGVLQARPLPQDAVERINRTGDNSNCMSLKGATGQYLGQPLADQWPVHALAARVEPDLQAGKVSVADNGGARAPGAELPQMQELGESFPRFAAWLRSTGILPDRDLYHPGDPRDLREIGAPVRGVTPAADRRLFFQLQAFGDCTDVQPLIAALEASGLEGVLYEDASDPRGVAVLLFSEDPESFVGPGRRLLNSPPFASLTQKPEFMMFGRTYAMGREPMLMEHLLGRPRRNALNPHTPWAVWYPLRRKGEFELLPPSEQGKILMEHAMIGRNYGAAGYAHDIRLACHGLDANDNEFVLGLVGPRLHYLSRLVQEMRKTQQTSRYIESLGPFFIGYARWQSPLGSDARTAEDGY